MLLRAGKMRARSAGGGGEGRRRKLSRCRIRGRPSSSSLSSRLGVTLSSLATLVIILRNTTAAQPAGCRVCANLSDAECSEALQRIVDLTPARSRVQLMTGLLDRETCRGLGDTACEEATRAALEVYGWPTVYAHVRNGCNNGDLVLSEPLQMRTHEDSASGGLINEEWMTAWRADCSQCKGLEQESDTECASALYAGFLELAEEDRARITASLYPAHRCAEIQSDGQREACTSNVSLMLRRMSQPQQKGLMLHACARGKLPIVRKDHSLTNQMKEQMQEEPASFARYSPKAEELEGLPSLKESYLPLRADGFSMARDATAAVEAAMRDWEGALAQNNKSAKSGLTDTVQDDGVREEEDSVASCEVCESLSDIQCRDTLDVQLTSLDDLDRLSVLRIMFPLDCAADMSDEDCWGVVTGLYDAYSDKERLSALQYVCEIGLLGLALQNSSVRRAARLHGKAARLDEVPSISSLAGMESTSRAGTATFAMGVTLSLSCAAVGIIVGNVIWHSATRSGNERTITRSSYVSV